MASPFREPLGTSPQRKWLFVERCGANASSVLSNMGWGQQPWEILSLKLSAPWEESDCHPSHSRQRPSRRVAAHIREWLSLLAALAPGGISGVHTRVHLEFALAEPFATHVCDEWLMKDEISSRRLNVPSRGTLEDVGSSPPPASKSIFQSVWRS